MPESQARVVLAQSYYPCMGVDIAVAVGMGHTVDVRADGTNETPVYVTNIDEATLRTVLKMKGFKLREFVNQ